MCQNPNQESEHREQCTQEVSKRWSPAPRGAPNFPIKSALQPTETRGTWLWKNNAAALKQYKGRMHEAQSAYIVALAGCRSQHRPHSPKSPLEGFSYHTSPGPPFSLAAPILTLALLSPVLTNINLIITVPQAAGPHPQSSPNGIQNSPVFKSMSDSDKLWPLWQLSAQCSLFFFQL